MSGQFDSELLNPDLQQEIATWDTLEQAYGGWSAPAEPVFISTADAVADEPRDYIETWNQPETGFPAPTQPATDVYSTAEAAPLEQVYTPSPTLEQLYGGAPEQQMYQPAEFLYGGTPAIEQPQPTMDFYQPEVFDWAPQPTSEDLAQTEGLIGYLNNEPVAPEWVQTRPSLLPENNPSLPAAFGWGAEGGPQPFFDNPNFAVSNAQFDATTNPANRTDALAQLTDLPSMGEAKDWLLQQNPGGLPLTTVQNAVGDLFEYARPLEQMPQTGPLGSLAALLGVLPDVVSAEANRGVGEGSVPTTPLEIGLQALPAARYGPTRAGLIELLGGQADNAGYAALDNLPDALKLRNLLQVPEYSDEAARLAGQAGQTAVPRVWGAAQAETAPFGMQAAVRGAGTDEGGDAFRAAKETLEAQFQGMKKGEIRAMLEAAGFGDEIVTNKGGTINLDKTYDAVARKAAGEGPRATVHPSMLDDVPPDVRQSLNLNPKGAPKDIIDDATEQVLRGDDYWPAPTPGSQPSLFGDAVQGFMEQAEGPNFYAPGEAANPSLSLNQARLNRGLQETAGNFDPNAVAPDSGFLRPQATNARMVDAGGIPQYAPGPVAEAPEVSLNTLKLIRAAQENPSTSNLVAAVDALLPKVSGQMMLDLGDMAIDGRSGWQRVTDELIGLIGAPRELKASFDQSIPGRQGLALAFRHPKEWVQSWKSIVPAWKSEEAFRIVNQDSENLITRWKQMVGEDGVVHLNSIDRNAPGTERIAGFEAKTNSFASNVAKRLGTEKWERSAVAFINSQRTKTMDTMFSALWNAATPTERQTPEFMEQFRNLSAIIDHATGYGAAPLKGDVASRLFFSQRFMTSRFQYLVDPIVEGVLKGDMNAARAATENLVAFAGGSAALLAMIDLGASKVGVDALDVEWDPRSSDFGKIRIGPQRIDFGAGFLPLIRSAAQIGTGEKKTTTGDIIPIQKMNMDTLKKESRVKASGNIALNFFRNKLDPVSGEAVTRFIAGEDPVGNKPTPIMSFTTLENLFAPLIASSTHEVLANGGMPGQAVFGAAAEFFGGSGSTYGAGQAAQQDTAQRQYGVDYARLPAQYQAQINAGIENIPISDRLSPWWQARDDAVQYLQSQLSETDTDPRYQAIREAKTYQDVQVNLQRVYEGEYGMTRAEAEKEVAALMRTLFEDNIDAYRHDVMAVDPGFAKAWLDAYNARETRYEPPKWVKELAQGQ